MMRDKQSTGTPGRVGGEVRISDFNPYALMIKGPTPVVQHDTVEIINVLRAEGYSVVVEPDVHVALQKGRGDFSKIPCY